MAAVLALIALVLALVAAVVAGAPAWLLPVAVICLSVALLERFAPRWGPLR